MSDNRPLFTVNNFNFSIFDSAPKPDRDTAYVLYKEGGNPDKILVITQQEPALGSTIRAGGYNKIAEVSLAWREYAFQQKIADVTGNFRFYVTVKLKYRISDCVFVFKSKMDDAEEVVRDIVSKIVEDCHKAYDIESQIELESALKDRVAERLKEITYLESKEIAVGAALDERATNIINAALDAMADESIGNNQNEQLTRKIQREKDISIKKLEAENEIQKRKNDLNDTKAEGVKALEEKLGESYSTFLAYINGEITSIEFDSRVQQNRSASMLTKLQALKQLVELDVLSGPALERAAVKLLGEGDEQGVIGQQAISDSKAVDECVIVEDVEEY